MQAMIEQYKSSPRFAFAEQRKPHLQEVDAAAPDGGSGRSKAQRGSCKTAVIRSCPQPHNENIKPAGEHSAFRVFTGGCSFLFIRTKRSAERNPASVGAHLIPNPRHTPLLRRLHISASSWRRAGSHSRCGRGRASPGRRPASDACR